MVRTGHVECDGVADGLLYKVVGGAAGVDLLVVVCRRDQLQLGDRGLPAPRRVHNAPVNACNHGDAIISEACRMFFFHLYKI